MNWELIPTIVANMKYSVIEYDYKFCKFRSIEKHKMSTGEDCDCHGDFISRDSNHFEVRAPPPSTSRRRRVGSPAHLRAAPRRPALPFSRRRLPAAHRAGRVAPVRARDRHAQPAPEQRGLDLGRGRSGRVLLSLEPRTGRTHQLRVHLALAGGAIAEHFLADGSFHHIGDDDLAGSPSCNSNNVSPAMGCRILKCCELCSSTGQPISKAWVMWFLTSL